MATIIYVLGACLLTTHFFMVSSGLRCVTCFNALHPVLCRSVGTCSQNQNHCGIHKFENANGEIRYHLGCFSTDTCNGKLLPQYIGRRKRAVLNTKCCDSDLCNDDPEHAGATDAAIFTDEKTSPTAKPDTELASATPINTKTTKVILSQSCNEHADCIFLIQHGIDICHDAELSVSLCPKSCEIC